MRSALWLFGSPKTHGKIRFQMITISASIPTKCTNDNQQCLCTYKAKLSVNTRGGCSLAKCNLKIFNKWTKVVKTTEISDIGQPTKYSNKKQQDSAKCLDCDKPIVAR